MNIVLIGFMGTGKSSVGRLLSKKLNYDYVDIDSLIVLKEKKEISEIFSEKGEEYFRKIESAMVKDVSAKDRQVISTGGGVVEKEENIKFLKKSGTVICLTATPEIIYERVKQNNSRPLLQGDNPLEKIKNLMQKREVFYKKADFMIDTSSISVEKVVEEIYKKIV